MYIGLKNYNSFIMEENFLSITLQKHTLQKIHLLALPIFNKINIAIYEKFNKS